MKHSTALFTCDVCGLRRIDGAVIPANWRDSELGLLCPECEGSIQKTVERCRGGRSATPVELAPDPANPERDSITAALMGSSGRALREQS